MFSTNLFADPHQPRVLLLPVRIINGTGSEWIGESVQQSLRADLHDASIAHPDAAIADDTAAIARIAHSASADFIVQGQVQIAEDQVRLTASVFNNAGTSAGSAKATGDLHHLFDLEDDLSRQIRDSIRSATVAKRPITTPIPTVQGSGPIRVAAAPALPIGTVPESYSSAALRDGRDRNIYQVPSYGCFGGWEPYGYCGFGGCGWGGVFNGGYSTGGGHSLAW